MNVFLNEKAKRDLRINSIEEDEFMKEALKEITYDESREKHDIISLVKIGETNYAIFGRRYRTTITITDIHANPIIVKKKWG